MQAWRKLKTFGPVSPFLGFLFIFSGISFLAWSSHETTPKFSNYWEAEINSWNRPKPKECASLSARTPKDVAEKNIQSMPLAIVPEETESSLRDEAYELQDQLVSKMVDFYSNLPSGWTQDTLKNKVEKMKEQLDKDYDLEGYRDPTKQKQNSIAWEWGHYIVLGGLERDGGFEVVGAMGQKPAYDLSIFSKYFGFPLDSLKGARVLDIGSWAGGTVYQLAALGARVTTVEEVIKFSKMTSLVVDVYQLPVNVLSTTLYALETPALHEAFKVVYFPGVLYHLSDPYIGLRILYNRLEPGGVILVETMGVYDDFFSLHSKQVATPRAGDTIPIIYENPDGIGNNFFTLTCTALTAMMKSVGFEEVSCMAVNMAGRARNFKGEKAIPYTEEWIHSNKFPESNRARDTRPRLHAVGRRGNKWVDFKRQGLSRLDVC